MIDSKLARATPRPVRLTVQGAFVNCLAFALLMGGALGGAFFYVRAMSDAELVRRAESEGVTAPGAVLHIRRDRGEEDGFTVSYQFNAGDAVHRGKARVSRRAGKGLETGAEVTVHYLKSEPARNWINSRLPNVFPVWTAPLLLVTLAIPAAMIFFQIHRQRAMLAEGRAAEGLVTDTKRIGLGESRGYRVQYEFTSINGKHWKRSCRTRRRPPEVGGTVTVLYDREEPQRSMIYPLPIVRVED